MMHYVRAMHSSLFFELPAYLTVFIQELYFTSVWQESDQKLYKPALESLRTHIRASTTSMTSVPKPLKFLRPHYDTMKEVHEKIINADVKVRNICCTSAL